MNKNLIAEDLRKDSKDEQALLRQRQREHWEEVSRTMPDLFSASSTQYYRKCEIALIQRYVGSLAGKRVLKLDLWNEAVNTRILNWMESEGAVVYGIDVSFMTTSRAVQHARDFKQPMHLAQADIRHLPFRNGSFDFVYTMGTIEHIDEYPDAVKEINRVLKTGGRTIIGVPHKWNVFLRPLLVKILDLFNKYPYAPEKSFSYGELRRVVEASGLRVQKRTGILTVPGIVRMADAFFFRRNLSLYRLSPLFIRPFEFLETRWEWPAYFGYLVALMAEKDGKVEIDPTSRHSS